MYNVCNINNNLINVINYFFNKHGDRRINVSKVGLDFELISQ